MNTIKNDVLNEASPGRSNLEVLSLLSGLYY